MGVFFSSEVAAVVVAAALAGVGWIYVRRVTQRDQAREIARSRVAAEKERKQAAASALLGKLKDCKRMVFGLDTEWWPERFGRLIELLRMEFSADEVDLSQLRTLHHKLVELEADLKEDSGNEQYIRSFNATGEKLAKELKRVLETRGLDASA